MKEIKVIYGSGTDKEGEIYYTISQEGIQKAINYANDNGGGTIFVTKGIYPICGATATNGSESYSLRLYSNITLKGEGSGTVLSCAACSGGSVISASGASLSNPLTNIRISDICLDGSGVTSRMGIYASNVSEMVIDNCFIKNFDLQGIYLSSIKNSLFTNNYVYNCLNSMSFYNGSEYNTIENNIMLNSTNIV